MCKQKWYILGCPSFGQINGHIKEFRAPMQQLGLCLDILKENSNPEVIAEKLTMEYIAIVFALKQMGINFYITYAKSEMEYKKLLAVCTAKLGIKLMGLPKGFPLHLASYPRDMFTIIGEKVILMNPGILWPNEKETGGYKVISSPFGEGGNALFREETILIAERYLDDKKPMALPNVDELEKIGLRIGLLPLPVAGTFSQEGIKNKFVVNSHLDRIECLIKGKDGKLHLIVDSDIHIAKIVHGISWEPCGHKESIERIKKVCDRLGIIFHVPAKSKVPYIFNLVQFDDGRILMSCGDADAYEIIAEIVGKENIILTEIPIRYFPVYAFAGIRCLLNEVPAPMLM